MKKRVLGTYPFAVPKIWAWYILKGNLFVMDHYSSLQRKQKLSTSILREIQRDGRYREPFQSPS
jgi:hypothetical protein